MPLLRILFFLQLLLPLTAWAQQPASRPKTVSAPAIPPKNTSAAPAAQSGGPPLVKGSRIELLPGTRELVGGVFNGVKIRKLIGNVSFRQDDAFLYCDSAYQYLERNEVEAFSNVRMVQNDTMTITGDRGFYDGDRRLARMTGNVVMRDPRMTLTTPALDYDLTNKTATYNAGGHLTDPQNTLDSQQGFYDTNSKVFVFKKNVHLVTPDSELNNDTLRYNTITKIAYFNGPTRIKGKQGNLYAEVGNYNTITRVSDFQKNAKIDTKDYLLGGDKLVYDELKLYGLATGHVNLVSKKDNITLRGDVGRYWRGLGRTKLYGGRPVVRNITDKDTLYLAADTLLSVEARPALKKTVAQREVLYAWPKVKIFRGNLQGICDSLTYDRQDSIIYLNRDPVLWQAKNQLTADSMELRQKRGRVDQMRLYANSFIVGQDTLLNFNQVKGRNMVAYFRDNRIARVDVLGNAESIYYALDNDTATTGMNKAVSANMVMRFAENKLKTISFLTNPDASFIPPHELKGPDQRLKGYTWRPTERPTRRAVLGKQFDDRPKPKPKTKAKVKPKTAKKTTKKTPAVKKPVKAPPKSGAMPTKPATPAVKTSPRVAIPVRNGPK